MDKAEFVKSAPMYYALAIAVALRNSPDNSDFIYEPRIRELYKLEIEPLFNQAVMILLRFDMIHYAAEKFTPSLLMKSESFNAAFTLLAEDVNSPFFIYSRLRKGWRSWLEDALTSVNDSYHDFKLEIEASDFDTPDQKQEQIPTETSNQQWEPIPLDRTEEKLQAAIGVLDETVEQLRSDNGYAEAHPQEKSYVLDKLRAVTKRLKEDTQISVMYLRNFAFEPLRILTKRFGKAAIGLSAGAATDALKEWLKREGINVLEKFFGG
jgi:hypothetical protein